MTTPHGEPTMNYVNADDLIHHDTRSPAEKWLDAELARRGVQEQGAEPGVLLRTIALELFEKLHPLGPIEAEERRHLWDGSPMPNHRIIWGDNTEGQRAP